MRKRQKDSARAKFAARLGASPDGPLKYLDWSCSRLRAEADRRKLRRPKKVDGSTLAHLLLTDDEQSSRNKKKPKAEAPAPAAEVS